MTPQMQQSIQLLQMNSQELEQLTQEELLENPFLQVEEDRSDAADETVEAPATPEGAEAPAEADPEAAPEPKEDVFDQIEAEVHAEDRAISEVIAPAAPEKVEAPAQADPPAEASADEPQSMEEAPEKFEEIDVNWEDFYDTNATYSGAGGGAAGNEEVREFTEYTAARISLYDHLLRQLRLCVLEGKEAEAGEYLIGCLDEDGYLDEGSLEDAASKFELMPDQMDRVLSIIQEFEPVGIAARTSAECLLLQMKALGSYSDLADRVLSGHFVHLQQKKFKEIAKTLDVPEKDIVDLYHKVSRLEPKPGRSQTKDAIQYISADVFVKIIDGKLTIYLNEGSSGHLSVNRLYRRMLRLQEQSFTKEDKEYAQEKFRGALMLIKNIEKRKSTIMHVTEAIMEVQREFLDKGVKALKPLTLREVADMVGMHESTIARVTSKKYVETPQGLYLLKFFFSSGISQRNGTGEAVSSRSFKDIIARYVNEEDPAKPLSDQKIAERLNETGYQIARRTVAKYREQMKILPAKLRREA